MAEIKIGGTPTYTIPLDSLDLAYLSKFVHTTGTEKMPLWTKKWLDGESEYCQVQIHTQRDHYDDCYSEPSDTYKCHICNILVPTLCSQKHNASERHETSKKLYQKVLENLSNQMDISTINKDQDIDKDVYYCEPCSKIIKIKNKEKHEISVHHAKSVKCLSVINDFFKILKENKNYDDCNANENLLGEEIDLESDCFKANYVDDCNDDNVKDCRVLFESDDDSLIHNPSVTPTNSIVTKNQPPNETKKEVFEEYLNEMIKKYNVRDNLPVVDGDSISIVAPNGETVKVSRENFHSYRELKNSVYCQLCNMWISQDTRPHDISEHHVRNIFRPINDKFARLIDTISSHCVPCNEVVPTNCNHDSLNDNHKTIIKNTKTFKTDKTYCEDCKLYIDSHNFPFHVNSKKHLNLVMQQNSIQKTGKDDIFCKFCNLTLPINGLKIHISSKLHLANKNNEVNNKNNDNIKINNETIKINNETIKINNETIKINNDTIKTNNKNNHTPALSNDSRFCEICKVKVPGGGMKIHIDGKPHKKVVSQLCSENKNDITLKENKRPICANTSSGANTASSGSTNKIYDSVASSNSLPNTSSGYSNGKNHEDEKISAYIYLLQFTDKSKTTVRCKICSVNILFVERKIIEHMESKNHIDNTNKKAVKYAKLLFFTDDEKSKVQCEICDVNVPFLKRNVIEHMEGKNHEAAENELLKFHLMTKESSEFVCECCDIRITDFLDHINSRTHTLKFQENYEIDKAELRKHVYDEDVNNSVSRRHRERYRNLLKHNGIYKLDDANYYCGMCQINLGRISEIDHVLGERHRSQLEKMNKLSTLLEQLDLTDLITLERS